MKDCDDKECEDIEDDQAEESRGGASNKYIFSKVSQMLFSEGFTSAKCMYFCKLLLMQKYLSLGSFCKYDLAQVHKHGFAGFSKFTFLQAFANWLS